MFRAAGPQKAGSCREDLQGRSPSNVTSSQNTGACRCVSELRLPGGTGRVSFVRAAISYIMFSASLRACGLLVACLIIEAVARKLSQKVGCSRENQFTFSQLLSSGDGAGMNWVSCQLIWPPGGVVGPSAGMPLFYPVARHFIL